MRESSTTELYNYPFSKILHRRLTVLAPSGASPRTRGKRFRERDIGRAVEDVLVACLGIIEITPHVCNRS
eukprot:7435551-Heterocapsa_arctica.AAC.1